MTKARTISFARKSLISRTKKIRTNLVMSTSQHILRLFLKSRDWSNNKYIIRFNRDEPMLSLPQSPISKTLLVPYHILVFISSHLMLVDKIIPKYAGLLHVDYHDRQKYLTWLGVLERSSSDSRRNYPPAPNIQSYTFWGGGEEGRERAGTIPGACPWVYWVRILPHQTHILDYVHHRALTEVDCIAGSLYGPT